MALDLQEKAALITAATVGAKPPIGFLVGSPLSQDSTGGVPGLAPMLEFVRQETRDRIPGRLPNFEDEVKGRSGAHLLE